MADVPKRSEVAREATWRLEDLFPSKAAWRESMNDLRRLTAAFEAYRGRLGTDGKTLAEALEAEDEVWRLAYRVYAYAMLRHDVDTEEAEGTAALQEADSLVAEVAQSLAFVRPELVALPEGRIGSLVEEERSLQPYRYTLRQIERRRPHILSTEAEAVMSALEPVLGGAQQVSAQLSDADLRFPDVLDALGTAQPLTHARYGIYMTSRDRTLRQNAYLTTHAAYEAHRRTFAATLAQSTRKDVTEARLRHYPSALAMRLDERSLDPAVYDHLTRAVREALVDLHRYVAWRKERLGVEAFHFYDLYPPAVEREEVTIPLDGAKDTVRRALEPLGPAYAARLDRVLGDRYLDPMENRGKRSGAYSMGIYDVHPYILMSYSGKMEGLFTLAHEAGHAVHSILSSEHQGFRNAEYTIFLAEIASTLNEHLLHDLLLKEAPDARARLALYDHQLQGFASTVFRQTLFAEFEEGIHREMEETGALTSDHMTNRYRALLETYYGPDLVVDDPGTYEWARIPHFYMSFYVFQYATGFLIASALADAILREGVPARDRYLAVLQAGGSDDPLRILDAAGIALDDGAILRQGLDVFRGLLDRVVALD